MTKFLRFAGVALLALTIGGGCGDDDPVTPVAPPPPPPPPIVGTVSGTVSVESSGLPGVTVNLSGAASQSATTGSSGGYSFADVPAGTHNVQISGAPADVAFASMATAVTIATSGQTATADFSGTYIRTSSIEGSVTAGGEGVVATVTATGTGMLTDEEPKIGSSDTDGNFELTGLRAGGYMVTISDYPEGTAFTVIARNVTVGVGLSATASFNAPGEDGPTGTGGLSIFITGVMGDEGPDKIAGRVTATIDVERGEFEKIALYVDGVEVDAELSGFGSAPAEEPALVAAQQQGGLQFELSFNSAEYDPASGKVTYPNGAHEIVAGVTVQGSTEESLSNRKDVEFENSSVVVASVNGLGDGARNSRTGRVWYGGPDVSVEISALAVSYSSGAAVSSVTLLQFCGDDAATDSEAPFSFPVDCDGFQSGEDGTTPMFNVDGAEIDTKGGEVYLDFKAPDAPHFQPNPNKRELGWVNADVGFTDEWEEATGKKDGWLIYNDDSEDNNADDGVGEYTPRIRAAKAAADKKVGGALAAPILTQDVVLPALAALAGQFSKTDEYCVVVSAVDMLGNESTLPKADEACVKADEYEVGSAGLLAGVDLQKPTIAFSPSSPEENAATMRNFTVQLDDDEGSGIRREDNNPVKASVNLRNKDDDEKIKDLKINVAFPVASTVGLSLLGDDDVGYYTFTGSVTDKAGNVSDEATRTALHDTGHPAASTIVGDYEKGQFSMVATVTDNLSIKAYWSEARFAAPEADLSLRALANGTVTVDEGLFLPQEAATDVDAYDAASLRQAILASSLTAKYYRALQADNDNEGTMLTYLNSLGVVASDHGGQKSTTPGMNFVSTELATDLAEFGFDLSASEIGTRGNVDAATVDEVDDSDRETFTEFAAEVEQSGGDVAVTVEASGRFFVMPVVGVDAVIDDADTDADESADAIVEVVGREGLMNDPLERIDFYATTVTFDIDGDDEKETVLKYIGTVDGADAIVDDFDNDIDELAETTAHDSRKYIYTLTISESALADMVGSKGDYLAGHIVAFGVKDDKGVALYAPAVVVADIEK